MKEYAITVWVMIHVDAEDEQGAIGQAADEVREMKPSDFEYEVEEATSEKEGD